EVPATAVAGCPIERVEANATNSRGPKAGSGTSPKTKKNKVVAHREADDKPVDVGQVSYAANVASIVQRKCQECHRPGQAAPFSLLTFADARDNAASIR